MIERALSEIGKLQVYQSDVFRIVETQEYAATTHLVDDLDEQDLLEQMLDEVKPPYRKGTEKLHYLISTPFRYPPLQYGSRFGDVMMPSYFYASEQIKTVLAECAFYRFVFTHDMAVPYEKPLNSEHMSFSVKIKTTKMADLTIVNSADIAQLLVSPVDYSFTQRLGKTLSDERYATVLRFYSARLDKGVNIAVNTPEMVASNTPENTVNWICRTTSKAISFNAHGISPLSFSLNDFLVNGNLPRLA